MDNTQLTIKDYYAYDITVKFKFFLYEVEDFMTGKMPIPGIGLVWETEHGEEPFAVLTKCFGEFIGWKNTAYIDANNLGFTDQFLALGIATNTGWTKTSGFCEYPLWLFNEEFLKEIGGEEYERYSKSYDDYMEMFCFHQDGEDETSTSEENSQMTM